MKKFMLFVSSMTILYIVVVLLLRVYWIQSINYDIYKNQLDSTKHTIVIGPSTGVYAWNDSILDYSINLCHPGESFASSYYRLRWAVEYNKNDIDTVILCASMPTFLYYTDSILDKDSRFLFTERSAFLYYDDFFKYNIHNKEYYKIVLTSIPYINFAHNNVYDGYIKSDMGLGKNGKDDNSDINTAIERLGSPDGLTKEYIKTHCTYQVEYMKRISDYCFEKNIQLIILSTPIYPCYKQLSFTGYDEIVNELCNDKTLIADYSFMEFEEKCYGDFEHLNTLGATVFCEYIRDNGFTFKSNRK